MTVSIYGAGGFQKSSVPISGSSTRLSGASPRTSPQLISGQEYFIVSQTPVYFCAGGSTPLSASAGEGYLPANVLYLHTAKSGSTDYVSFFGGANVDVTIYPSKQ